MYFSATSQSSIPPVTHYQRSSSTVDSTSFRSTRGLSSCKYYNAFIFNV